MSFFYNFFKTNKVLNWALIIVVIILLGLTITYTTKLKEGFETKENKLLIFYANWCGYCKSAMPAFQKLKNDYDNQKINNNFVSIDLIEGDKNSYLMSKYNVSGFPTILLSKSNGQTLKYHGDRSYEDLVVFLRQNV